MKEINVILNGEKVTGHQGESILELCSRNGISIPTLCHDPRLEPYSSCYVCVVEVGGMRGMQPSCSTKINEGMTIETETEKVKAARKTALDLILSNHYADCIGPCKDTCPAGVDVQGYISLIEKGKYTDAVALIKEDNPLPAICGRVCVRPCEVACRRNLLDEGTGVGVDYMKRFAADYDLNSPEKFKPEVEKSTGKNVAVIGAGPGGLSCGFFLQQKGHQVDIFEAAPAAGGWLRYGIPEYRLPNDLLQKEVDNITDLGVNIFYNKKLGKDVSYKELKQKYDSVILTIGSQKGTSIGCEGDDAENVYPGIDFLKNMEITQKRPDFSGKTVAVVGGGNTAMDCCRTSIRCGAEKVYVVYRRTEKEMPANPIEIHESKLEGVEYLFLNNPVKVNKDEEGKVKSMTLIKMELGEPDASGRRRPVPVEGSEYDIDVDFILAAIGQKTIVDFIDDVNSNTDEGELKINKWGDIAADKLTLQTGIPSMFAAGDGVTGPATLIEAVAQAKIASRSCHQFLSGEEIKPPVKEFLSKKDNFKTQDKTEYTKRFTPQMREEMPVLKAEQRMNFNEVELGYADENIVKHEANRCLECGCTEYFTCDLKEHATTYGAEQKKYDGQFIEYEIDHSHPYIEIDNNKCVLCSRCVRICKDVVGASALGLVERGFETFVAPSMGNSLVETTCESCGLCISACPTGAITENVPFKPGPVKFSEAKTICNFCSVGCEIVINHKSGFAMRTSGADGLINKDGNLCRYPKFGYHYLNDGSRITKPLLKNNGRFEEISFEKAFDLIEEKIKQVAPDENTFFAGARLSNEELYLVQKFARAGVKTNNISSFHYLGRGDAYRYNSNQNVPFEQINGVSKFYLFGSEINLENAVAGFMIQSCKTNHATPISLITEKGLTSMDRKVDNVLRIKSYYNFVRAVNHYLLTNNLQNDLFINDNCEGFAEYKEVLLKEDFEELVKASGVDSRENIEAFSKEFNEQINAVIVFSEKNISSNTSLELFNLAMITGKLGKTSNGLISLKEKNNSQGLFDMGITPDYGVGGQKITDESFITRIKEIWNIDNLPVNIEENQYELLNSGKAKNIFIFGEDPVGCTKNSNSTPALFAKKEFMVVQDSFITETAKLADIILPASFPIETGGSFTNTQKVIQNFGKEFSCKIEKDNVQQLISLLQRFGFDSVQSADDAMMEAVSLFSNKDTEKIKFINTCNDNSKRLYEHGCDYLTKYFDDEFTKSFM